MISKWKPGSIDAAYLSEGYAVSAGSNCSWRINLQVTEDCLSRGDGEIPCSWTMGAIMLDLA